MSMLVSVVDIIQYLADSETYNSVLLKVAKLAAAEPIN